MCHLRHKTISPHTEFLHLKRNISLKQVHYLVEQEKVLPTQKNDCHPVLVDYDDDQFTLRSQDKGNTFTYFPLNYFSFQSVSPFSNKYKKPVENKLEKTSIKSILK